ncbi:MAG: AAA family ATPase [Clostridium sp.]|nr:AAA family ATPase [Clostridium sp.]
MSTFSQNDNFDFAQLWRKCRENWYWFLISVCFCCGLAFAYIKIHKPIYPYNANIYIAKESGDFSSMIPDVGAFSGMLGIKNSVDDEMLIMKSHSTIRRVISEMGLERTHIERNGLFNMLKEFKYNDYAVDIIPSSPTIPDTLGATLKFKVDVDAKGKAKVDVVWKRSTIAEAEGTLPVLVSTPFGEFSVVTTKDYKKGKKLKYVITYTGYDNQAELLLEDLKIDVASKKSSIINISYKHFNRDYACELIDNLMDLYNKRGVTENRQKDSLSLAFFDSRLNIVGQQMIDTQNELSEFLKRENIVDIEATTKFEYEMRGEVEKALTEAETNLEIIRMLRDFLTDPSNEEQLLPYTTAVDPEVVQAYNESVLYVQRIRKSARGDNKPLRNALNDLRQTRQSILETVNRAYSDAKVAADDLRRKSDDNIGRLARFPEQQREIVFMIRDTKVQEKLFAFLAQQREQYAMKVANYDPKGRIVDHAYSSIKPIGMSSKIIMGLAFMFGLAFPLAVIYIRGMIRGQFETASSVSRRTDTPVLGEIHHLGGTDSPVISETTDARPEAESFRTLRANLLHHLGTGKRILITSAVEGEGTSFVSINLASSLAMLGKRTILVEMNLRSPSLAETLDVRRQPGLTDLIHGTATLSEVTIKIESESSLWMIPAGSADSHPSETLSSATLDTIMTELASGYDYIVIDSAPLLNSSDTLSLGRMSDITLFVTRANYSALADLSVAEQMEEENRFPNIMIVVNDTEHLDN